MREILLNVKINWRRRLINMLDKLFILAVDFDGTLCEDKFPEIGEPKERNIQFVLELERLAKNMNPADNREYKRILWTCRHGEHLDKAIAWCKEQGIEFDEVNTNIPEVKELFKTDTRKVYANKYFDDKVIKAI